MKCRFALSWRRSGAGAARRAPVAWLVLAIAAAALPGLALALSGDLDPDFDGDGKVAIPIGSGGKSDEAFAIGVQPSGRIVVAGYGDTPKHIAAVRLMHTGALDGSFGAGGIAKFTVGARSEAHAVAVGAGNVAVLAGYAAVELGKERFAVLRLLSGGGIDPAFNGGAAVTIPFPDGSTERDAQARAVAIHDGRIVVGGWMRTSANRNLALARLESDGDLDPTFGGGTGKIALPVGSGHDEIAALAVDGDDRIVVAGFATNGILKDVLVARFLADGTPDPDFGAGGFALVDFAGSDDEARALALLDDGNILVAGTATIAGTARFAALRLDEDGVLDPSFGDGGRVTTPIGTLAEGHALAVEPGHRRFAIAGSAKVSGQDGFAVVQYREDGSLAANFGSAGVTTFKIGTHAEIARAAALQADGNLLVAGTARSGSNADFGVARLLVEPCGNGVIDPGEGCDTSDLGGASCCSLTCQIVGAGTVCRAADGACDAQEVCDGIGTSCPADLPVGAGAVCRASAGICDVTEFCNGSAKTCPPDQVLGAATLCRAAAGICDAAEMCSGSSVACPADQKKAAGTPCRAAAGSCDVAETCDGSASACPADAIAPAGTVCRASAGVCDVAEQCNGSSTACPADALVPTTTVCRAAAGDCDVAESCDGAVAACPADVRIAAGTTCRVAAGDCDIAEACDGSGAACPSDQLLANGTTCRAASDLCDAAERCDGATPACPPDAISPQGAVCRPPLTACDAPEACDGIVTTCPPDVVLAAATVCREAAGACDVAESCDGVSGICPADEILPAGTECRAAAGDCDVAEQCDGFAAACPVDLLVPARTVCRDAVDVCDVADKCKGTSVDCPADRKRRDKDGDGTCDLADVCPRDADPDQTDADGDGAGDLCDACTGLRAIDAALLDIAGYATPAGDDTFKLRGELAFETPPVLAPATTGIRILVRDGDGKALYDVTVPPGERPVGSRIGWRSNETKKVYSFNTTTAVGGIVRKVKLSQPAVRPGVVKITITGRAGGFATAPVALPLAPTVVLDPTPEVVELCGGASFPGPAPDPACAFDELESRLTCQ